MSIKLMSAVFFTEFRDLPTGEKTEDGKEKMARASSMKITLLAIADQANDEGESAYPGYTRLELKTGLSRQGLADVIKALKYNGIISVDQKPSKLNTNNYTINKGCLSNESMKEAIIVKPLDQSSHLTDGSQATLPEVVKPLDLKRTINQQETSFGAHAPDMPLDWQVAHNHNIVQPDDFTAKARDAANLVEMGCAGAGGLAEAFMLARRILIPESKVKGNRRAAREMLEMGVKPEHVTQAVKDLTAKGMTVTDLFAVVKTSVDLANKANNAPKDRSFGL